MKAIILAAGKGSRISDKIGDIPKALLEVGGKPIIRGTVQVLKSLGMDIVVCTGYRSEKIEGALSGLDVHFYRNPFYDVTNNIASLWFAKEEISTDTLVLSADLVFDKAIVEKIIAHKGALVMAADKTRILDGDYFFRLSDEGHILEYGPELPENKRDCEYVGICKVSKDVASMFKGRLEEFIFCGRHGNYFELVFLSFTDNIRATAMDVDGLYWREIDFYEDYLKVLERFPALIITKEEQQ